MLRRILAISSVLSIRIIRVEVTVLPSLGYVFISEAFTLLTNKFDHKVIKTVEQIEWGHCIIGGN